MKPPGVLVNARAGRVQKDPGLVSRLRRLVPPDHLHLTRSADELPEAFARLRHADVETVAIVGGDGTVTWTLSALLRAWPEGSRPSVLLLPGGTINTVAGSIGARGAPDRILSRLLSSETPVSEHPRSLIAVHAAGAETRYGLIFGTGAPARWITHYNRIPRRNLVRAVSEVTRTLASVIVGGRQSRSLFAAFQAEVEVGEEKVPFQRFTGMAAGSVQHLGLGFRPFYSVPREGRVGSFHWIMTDLGGRSYAWELPIARLGRQGLSRLKHTTTRTVRIRLAQPAPYTVDGDLFPATTEIYLEAGPEVRFILPRRWARRSSRT